MGRTDGNEEWCQAIPGVSGRSGHIAVVHRSNPRQTGAIREDIDPVDRALRALLTEAHPGLTDEDIERDDRLTDERMNTHRVMPGYIEAVSVFNASRGTATRARRVGSNTTGSNTNGVKGAADDCRGRAERVAAP